MLQLTATCDIYRMLPKQPSGKSRQRWRRNVPCLVIPLSAYDKDVTYARESDHVIFLPRWLSALVQNEDELHTGRRMDLSGTAVPQRYTVNGIRRFPSFGLRHTEVFVKELT